MSSGKWRPFCLGLNELIIHKSKVYITAIATYQSVESGLHRVMPVHYSDVAMASQIASLTIYSCDQAALWMVQSVCLSLCLPACLSARLSVCPSVCLSVTHVWLCSHHRIIMKFSGVITNDRSDVHAKGRGQRSKVKVTEVTTQLNRLRTVTPVWIHIEWWNDAYRLILIRRGALLFFKVPSKHALTGPIQDLNGQVRAIRANLSLINPVWDLYGLPVLNPQYHALINPVWDLYVFARMIPATTGPYRSCTGSVWVCLNLQQGGSHKRRETHSRRRLAPTLNNNWHGLCFYSLIPR